jgi:hypothetical protein
VVVKRKLDALLCVEFRKFCEAEWYGLSLSQVYAALAFYCAHKDEIDQAIRQQISRSELLKEKRSASQD